MSASQPRTAGYHHVPVLLDEVSRFVPEQATLLADVTLGGAGHAAALLQAVPAAALFGSDRDPQAIAAAKAVLQPYASRVLLKTLPFARIHTQLLTESVDFLLADLGVSSPQLMEGERGFSFNAEGPLDMRMNPEDAVPTAAQLLEREPVQRLRELLVRYGEERYAGRIARAIDGARRVAPLRTTRELARLVAAAVPAKRERRHPATRTFQALRIAVNDELGQLTRLLEQALPLLKPGGRMVVIAFHSLEDRLVKTAFARWERPCQCPSELPRCICGLQPAGRRLTRKPLRPAPAECARNPPSRSARLRVFEKTRAGGQGVTAPA